MRSGYGRREFLKQAAVCAAAARGAGAQKPPPKPPPYAPDHSLTVIAGTPRGRGLVYGRKFGPQIRTFLEQEVYTAFTGKPASKQEMLAYAGRCLKEVRGYAPLLAEEMEGMADGAGLRLEELTLLLLHEELWHKGVLPQVEHCTAIAAGPPSTGDGNTYVGQSWDWMVGVYGRSSMLYWKRPEGPSVLTYSYPGLWTGAGLNSAGIALCWTSVQNTMKIPGPRVGIPTYVLIAQLLYQDSLEKVEAEARRARHAGWFTFVLADGEGRLLNLEGSPEELVVERGRGKLSRVYYGTRRMTRTPEGQEIPVHPQCRRMRELLDGRNGTLDRGTLQGFYADHQSTICKHYGTLDVMLFNTTAREAWVTRGPGCSGRWKRFTFQDA